MPTPDVHRFCVADGLVVEQRMSGSLDLRPDSLHSRLDVAIRHVVAAFEDGASLDVRRRRHLDFGTGDRLTLGSRRWADDGSPEDTEQSPRRLVRMAAGRSSGAQATAAVVTVTAVAGLAALFTGGVRLALIVVLAIVASAGALYMLSGWTPIRVLAGDALRRAVRRYDRGRYATWLHAGLMGTPPEWGLAMVLRHPDHRTLTMNDMPNPIVAVPGLRCEVRLMFRRRVYLCVGLRAIDSGHAAADFPPELTQDVPAVGPRPMKLAVRGAYVARWKSDDRKRIARRTIRCDGERYLPHPAQRVLGRILQTVHHLRGLDGVDPW